MRTRLALLLLAGWCIVGAAGCGESAPTSDPSKTAETAVDALETEATRGPVTVRLRLTPKQPMLSDVISVEVDVISDEGVAVELPSMRGALGEFVIRDLNEGLPEVRDGKRMQTLRYSVEPTRSGTHLIRPVRVSFVVPADAKAGGKENRHVVATEPIRFEIGVADEGLKPDLAAIEGPRDLVDVPAPLLPFPWWWLAVGAGALLAIGGFWWWRRSHRRPPPERRYTAEELAYLEMQQLIQTDLVAQRDYSGFYVELTGIVRRYIERTTDIHAPEQTTEEFLSEMRTRSDFPLDRQQRLADFLEAADLIKFAGQIPGADEIEASFDRAKAFVGLAERERAA